MGKIDRDKVWRIRSLRSDHEWEGPLVAHWEVHFDPISNKHSPIDMAAIDLLRLWSKLVREEHGDGMIPIFWSVESPGHGKYERMPFQPNRSQSPIEDFLSFYTWPVEAATNERLNWLQLPVADKQWNQSREDTGGFIQEATGWKPSILQPLVYLPSLESVL